METDHDWTSEPDDAASGSVPPEADVGVKPPWVTRGDPLSDVLETIRLRGALFFIWEPSWHYATEVPDGCRFGELILPGAWQIVSYHIVTEGPCWAAVPGEEPVSLETGDILLLAHGDPYCISSRPHPATTEDNREAIEFFRLMAAGELPLVIADGGGREQHNRLICGFLGCDRRPFNPLLDALPRMLRIPALREANDPLTHLIEFALSESQRESRGGRALLVRLSEVMFVEVLRRYVRTAPSEDFGWLAGLHDPLVGRALELIHRRPRDSWTLTTLADELATSRSTLAQRFSARLGEPPMHYLGRWRMQLAVRRLADHSDKIYAIARDVGYESEAAFSRAFKRWLGVSPKQWRERASNGPFS